MNPSETGVLKSLSSEFDELPLSDRCICLHHTGTYAQGY